MSSILRPVRLQIISIVSVVIGLSSLNRCKVPSDNNPSFLIKKRLENSKECYRRFGDEDSKQWIAKDEQKVAEIEQKIEAVIAYMDAHNIQ